ncbi:hypothetical protein CRYUN_Cryun16bG0031800 [Craigia yunnanensis]
MQRFGYQGVEGAMSNPLELNSVATLLIRHLPEAIPHDTFLWLFSHYGVSSVRPCSGGKLRNCAFVDFKKEALAYQAQHQLNGLIGTGVLLRKDFPQSASLVKDANLTRDLNQGSRSGSIHAREPIAPRLGVDYPFPPHLEFAYPPPDGNILTNIVNALIAVPRFYTQVLHQMNKTNIPAPFRMALPTPPLPLSVPVPQPPPPPPLPASTPEKPHLAFASSSESEMESSDEEVNDKGVTKSTRKRARREAIVGPAIDKSVVHEAVGVKPATLIPKEIPLIKKNPLLQIKIATKHIPNEQKDDDDDYKQISAEPNEEDSDAKRFATADELEKGKLPPEEILSLPIFKNLVNGYVFKGKPTIIQFGRNPATAKTN